MDDVLSIWPSFNANFGIDLQEELKIDFFLVYGTPGKTVYWENEAVPAEWYDLLRLQRHQSIHGPLGMATFRTRLLA